MDRYVSLIDRAVLPLPKLKRVVAYARVSSGKDEMIHSLSAQISYYSEMIQSHPGLEYVGVYSDKTYTGTKSARPDFERLLNDCRAGKNWHGHNKVHIEIYKKYSGYADNSPKFEGKRHRSLLWKGKYIARHKPSKIKSLFRAIIIFCRLFVAWTY